MARRLGLVAAVGSFTGWYYERMNSYHRHKLRVPGLHYNFYLRSSWQEQISSILSGKMT